jgi:photosystem II stability/assembly factor-like uncharacterized protein
MKKTIMIFLLFSIVVHPQWIHKQIFTDQILQSVFFLDSLNGWICGNNGVIYNTNNGGIDWLEQISGESSILKKIRFADSYNGWIISEEGTVLKTTNGGLYWVRQFAVDSIIFNHLSVIDSQSAFIIGRTNSYKFYLWKTLDGGVNWNHLNLAQPIDQVTDITFINKNIGWYCTANYSAPFTNGRIYLTSNGGESWHLVLSQGSLLRTIDFIDQNYGWCAGDWKLFYTTNGGSSWVERGLFPSHYFSKIKFVDTELGWIFEMVFAVNENDSGLDKGINFTSDGGHSWQHQFSYMTYRWIRDLCFVEKRIGWMILGNGSTPTSSIIVTTNNGGGVFPSYPELVSPANYSSVGSDSVQFKWHSAHPSVSGYTLNVSIDSNFISFLDTLVTDTTIFLNFEVNKRYYWRVRAQNNLGWGGFSNVNSFDTYLTDLKENDEPLKQDFALHQNYPNPFNPSTVISFQLPVAGDVTVKIYDVLGREVATLVDEYRNAGIYEVQFNAGNISSGVYIYILKVNEASYSKSMIIIK